MGGVYSHNCNKLKKTPMLSANYPKKKSLKIAKYPGKGVVNITLEF